MTSLLHKTIDCNERISIGLDLILHFNCFIKQGNKTLLNSLDEKIISIRPVHNVKNISGVKQNVLSRLRSLACLPTLADKPYREKFEKSTHRDLETGIQCPKPGRPGVGWKTGTIPADPGGLVGM